MMLKIFKMGSTGITIDYLRELGQPVAKCDIVYDVPL